MTVNEALQFADDATKGATFYDGMRGPLMTIAVLAAEVRRLREINKLRPIDEYHEDHGFVLWWKLPIEEPPYVGSPNCSDWPGCHTHWCKIECPEDLKQ